VKKHPVLRDLLIDLLCAGLALVVFALFHHVLPRQQQGLGIVIPDPYKKTSPAEGSDTDWPDSSLILADAGVTTSDAAAYPITARGGRGNTGRSSGGSGSNSDQGSGSSGGSGGGDSGSSGGSGGGSDSGSAGGSDTGSSEQPQG
jgi:hypothetical protein